MKNTALVKSASSLEYFKKGQAISLESTTEEEVVAIIKNINKTEKYWWQEPGIREDRGGNMSPPRPVQYVKIITDEFGKKKLFEPFTDFVFEAVKFFPNLTLYVHNGPFGFYPIFGVRYLNKRKKPYLIKFTEGKLEKKQYQKMVKVLYSKENKEKHKKAGLEEIQSLSYYDY